MRLEAGGPDNGVASEVSGRGLGNSREAGTAGVGRGWRPEFAARGARPAVATVFTARSRLLLSSDSCTARPEVNFPPSPANFHNLHPYRHRFPAKGTSSTATCLPAQPLGRLTALRRHHPQWARSKPAPPSEPKGGGSEPWISRDFRVAPARPAGSGSQAAVGRQRKRLRYLGERSLCVLGPGRFCCGTRRRGPARAGWTQPLAD